MSKTLPLYKDSGDRPDFDRRLQLRGEGIREARETVLDILDAIDRDGWDAVRSLGEQYDDYAPEGSLSGDVLQESWEGLTSEQQDAYGTIEERVRRYQDSIKPSSSVITDGENGLLGEVVRPLETVGCYIPGGRFPLPSTVFMTVLVADVAGVDNIVVTTPPADGEGRPHPEICAALSRIDGVEVYPIGGAQAVGAMAAGTGPLPAVDLIAGPGNLYVTLAKKEVYGSVGIDLLAGPSEIAVIATPEASRADWVAADLLSQAEHDPRARSFCFSPDEKFLENVRREVQHLLEDHPDAEPVREALTQSGLIRTDSIEEAIELSNELAPEHLELHLTEPGRWARDCRNAGAIFAGSRTPEPIGDYVAGPSHTLPTQGGARFFSSLSVRTFTKSQSLIRTSTQNFMEQSQHGETVADMENLWAHKKSLTIRKENGVNS